MRNRLFEKAIQLPSERLQEVPDESKVNVLDEEGSVLYYFEATLDPVMRARKEVQTKSFNSMPPEKIAGMLRQSAATGAPISRGFLEDPGGDQLFDALYNFKLNGPFLVEGKPEPIDTALATSEAGFAVRNRRERLSRIFDAAYTHLSRSQPMMSIGYGSGRARLEQEAMRHAVDKGEDVYFVGFDINPKAQQNALELAKELNLQDRVRLLLLDHDMLQDAPPIRQLVAEAAQDMGIKEYNSNFGIFMGILEYIDIGRQREPFSNVGALNLHQGMLEALDPEAYLVSTQTKPHDREQLLENLPKPWICRYRNEHEHLGLTVTSGFTPILTESDPTGLSSYIVAQKPDTND